MLQKMRSKKFSLVGEIEFINPGKTGQEIKISNSKEISWKKAYGQDWINFTDMT